MQTPAEKTGKMLLVNTTEKKDRKRGKVRQELNQKQKIETFFS